MDCADFGCSRSEDPEVAAFCRARSETSAERCSDGRDNDGNGFIDCQDFSCTGSDADPEAIELCERVTERSAANCSDGIDNDGNGFIDCRDNGCRFSNDPAVKSVCFESADPAACGDGIDNDGDGFTDCDDFDCAYNPDVDRCRAQTKPCE